MVSRLNVHQLLRHVILVSASLIYLFPFLLLLMLIDRKLVTQNTVQLHRNLELLLWEVTHSQSMTYFVSMGTAYKPAQSLTVDEAQNAARLLLLPKQ